MRLLFITQKLHGQDAFGVLWIREFIRQGYEVTVICLEGRQKAQKREEGQEGVVGQEEFKFQLFTLGKEHGASKLQSVLRFEKLIATLPYDRVFVHMAPVWYALGFWLWKAKRVPTYLWYTHYKMQLGVRLFGWFGTRFFCATPQSLPQYEGSKKKTVVGHGIDLSFWPKRANVCTDPHRLLVVHRLSRSKRLELSVRALPLLDSSFTIDVYGIEAEADYAAEMKALVNELKLTSRVIFHGTVPMQKLPEIYCSHRLILNMASETIDKTMLEAMTCGCYPVTTVANASAIAAFTEGEIFAPQVDTSEAIAAFIHKYAERPPMNAEQMYNIVSWFHSLEALVKDMSKYMQPGE